MSNQTLWGGGSPSSDSVSVSAYSLTYSALRELGVLRVGSGPSAEWLADGQDKLNKIVDAWSAESLLVPSIGREVYALRAGVQEYSLGPSGDLDGTRPPRITRAAMVPAVGDEYEIEVTNDGGWPTMTLQLTSAVPAAGDSLAIYAPVPLQTFADQDTQHVMPHGYALALELTLASQLAARALLHMKTAIPAALLSEVKENARQAVGRIKRANHRMGLLQCDDALVARGSFDILRGRY